MKIAMLALLVLPAFGTAAQAQESVRTREDVLRELADARRMGELVIAGCGGGTYREAFPNKYPSRDVSHAVVAPRRDDAVGDGERGSSRPVSR